MALLAILAAEVLIGMAIVFTWPEKVVELGMKCAKLRLSADKRERKRNSKDEKRIRKKIAELAKELEEK